MGARNLLLPVLGLLFLVSLITAETYIYEFGERLPQDFLIYKEEGVLPERHSKSIPIKLGVILTYVKLTLDTDGFPPTKVTFDWKTKKFQLIYDFKYTLYGLYKVEAIGVVFYPPKKLAHTRS